MHTKKVMNIVAKYHCSILTHPSANTCEKNHKCPLSYGTDGCFMLVYSPASTVLKHITKLFTL